MHTIFKLSLSLFLVLSSALALAADKPIQHRVVDDITDYNEAKKVFTETSAEIKSKTQLNEAELHEIHMITYSLEKSIAYFVDKLEGTSKEDASKIAEIVELIHLGSENNREEETKVYLEKYFEMAKAFAKDL